MRWVEEQEDSCRPRDVVKPRDVVGYVVKKAEAALQRLRAGHCVGHTAIIPDIGAVSRYSGSRSASRASDGLRRPEGCYPRLMCVRLGCES